MCICLGGFRENRERVRLIQEVKVHRACADSLFVEMVEPGSEAGPVRKLAAPPAPARVRKIPQAMLRSSHSKIREAPIFFSSARA